MTSQVGGGTDACASSGQGRQSGGGGLSDFIEGVHGDSSSTPSGRLVTRRKKFRLPVLFGRKDDMQGEDDGGQAEGGKGEDDFGEKGRAGDKAGRQLVMVERMRMSGGRGRDGCGDGSHRKIK